MPRDEGKPCSPNVSMHEASRVRGNCNRKLIIRYSELPSLCQFLERQGRL